MQQRSAERQTPLTRAALRGLTLPLYGEARLEHHGKPVPTRAKALALLYFLALHGPTPRSQLASLLWSGGPARENLRVNLHSLRKTLEKLGYSVFPDAADPLKLPDPIAPDATRRDGMPLMGLDDLSPDFQAWVEGERARLGARAPRVPVQQALVEELAANVRAPFVLVLQAPPGGDSARFAQALARQLDLPFAEGLSGDDSALRYVHDYESLDARRFLTEIDRKSALWVLERPLYGQDPRMLLEVRSRYPAERLRYVELPSLSWPEARRGLLGTLDFEEAAGLYLDSCGEPRYLRELVNMTVPGRHPIGGAVPHRVRAAYELHLRELSPPTQLALKGLAVHPGRLPDALVHAFANGTALYELELHNWLVYEDVWRVSRATAQRVLYQSLMPGQRLQFRQQAAKALAAGGHRLAATYHRLRLGKTVDVADLLEHVSGWRRPVLAGALGAVPTLEPLPTASVYVGSPLALGCEGTRGPGVQVDGSFGRWWRTADVSEAGRAVWSLPPESLVMRISGRALVHNPLGIGLHGDAAPLRIRVLGTDLTIVLCDVPEPGLADDDIVLPIDVDFEYTLALPPATGLEIESKARTGVVELELTLCRHEGGRLGSRNDTGPAESAFDLRSGRLLRRALRRMRGNYQARQDG